ncbi:nitroreductase [Hyphodiscus hymeniophilus]|uniref:Nitroreductase n=1 Tax=Hyphodiscus hymeniophilus TaxID=353542 RepID=A0A9P6VGT4_9HELO|nr:nitroreductase [Hyphodiscus hymeniophilus]
MHIPSWLFLTTILLALTWQDMASLLLRKAPALSSTIKASIPASIRRNLQPLLNQHPNPQRSFSATPATMSGSAAFLEAVKNRRTVYQLKKESTISDSKIEEIVTEALLHVPSSFNSQSTRLVVLLKEEHDKLWQIAKDVLKAVVPAESYASTEQRLSGFQGAYGTVSPSPTPSYSPNSTTFIAQELTLIPQVLFFINRPTVSGFQEKLPIYADKFPTWATQSDGMHQYAIWAALEKEGLGANLQHYNPLIDQKVTDTWGISKDWELSAQLVFGTPIAPAGEKAFMDVKERLKVFGA